MSELFHKPVTTYFYKQIQPTPSIPIAGIMSKDIDSATDYVISKLDVVKIKRMLMLASVMNHRRIPSDDGFRVAIQKGVEAVITNRKMNAIYNMEFFNFVVIDGHLNISLNIGL